MTPQADKECYDFCPYPSLRDDICQIKDDIRSINTEQKKIIEVMTDIKYLRENIHDIKKENVNIFERLRNVEIGKVSKRDVYTIAAVLGVIISVLNFIFTRIPK